MEFMTTEAFGEIVRLKREDLGLTQKELSDKCGVDRSSISKLESGDLVGAQVYDKITSALDIKISLTFPREKK
jgi:transcriptional regulator with XRE-family HTH domain